MEKYPGNPHNILRAVRDLAKTATRHLTTQTLSTHGDHFQGINHQVTIPMPTHFDEQSLFPEFYGHIEELPMSWDKHGYPRYMDDYPYTHEFDSKPTRDIRTVQPEDLI